MATPQSIEVYSDSGVAADVSLSIDTSLPEASAVPLALNTVKDTGSDGTGSFASEGADKTPAHPQIDGITASGDNSEDSSQAHTTFTTVVAAQETNSSGSSEMVGDLANIFDLELFGDIFGGVFGDRHLDFLVNVVGAEQIRESCKVLETTLWRKNCMALLLSEFIGLYETVIIPTINTKIELLTKGAENFKVKSNIEKLSSTKRVEYDEKIRLLEEELMKCRKEKAEYEVEIVKKHMEISKMAKEENLYRELIEQRKLILHFAEAKIYNELEQIEDKTRLLELKASITRKKEEIDKLENELESYRLHVSTLEKEHHEIKTSLSEHIKQRAELEQDIEVQKQQRERAESKAAIARAWGDITQAREKVVTEKLAATEESKRRIEEKLKRTEDEVCTIKEENNKLKDTGYSRRAKRNFGWYDDVVARKDTEIDQLKIELQTSEKYQSHLENMYRKLQQALTEHDRLCGEQTTASTRPSATEDIIRGREDIVKAKEDSVRAREDDVKVREDTVTAMLRRAEESLRRENERTELKIREERTLMEALVEKMKSDLKSLTEQSNEI